MAINKRTKKFKPFGLKDTPYNPMTGKYAALFREKDKGGGDVFVSARCLNTWSESATISCIKLDHDGNVSGSAFSVYVLASRLDLEKPLLYSAPEYDNDLTDKDVSIYYDNLGNAILMPGIVRRSPGVLFHVKCLENIATNDIGIKCQRVDKFGTAYGDELFAYLFPKKTGIGHVDNWELPDYDNDLTDKTVFILQDLSGSYYLAPGILRKKSRRTYRAYCYSDLPTSPASAVVSVKLLDSDNEVFGDLFDVYIFPDRSIMSLDDTSKSYAVIPYGEDLSGKIVDVIWGDDDNWYLHNHVTLRDACEEVTE